MRKRIDRERHALTAQLHIYCRARHGAGQKLCSACADRQHYIAERMERCELRAAKPTCTTCAFRCYAPPQQVKLRAILRYAGPRLLRKHPLLALWLRFDTQHAPAR
jgi:predicted amidophosphoribosyltransferase